MKKGMGVGENLNVREACPGDSVSNALVAWAWLSRLRKGLVGDNS